MKAISLYWFVVQQQIITFSCQKFGLFNQKFSTNINKLNKTSIKRFSKITKKHITKKSRN